MPSQTSRVRAAVVQSAPIAFERERTLDKVAILASEASNKGAQLVVFPEAFVSAYPRGATFGAVIGSRSPDGRELYRRYWESSVDVPGPATQVLADVAAQNHIYLVIGIIERDGGTLYCIVLFFDPNGFYLG